MVGFETAALGEALGSVLAGALAAWLGAELASLLGVALLPPPVEQALTSAMIDAPRASVRRIRMWVPPWICRAGTADSRGTIAAKCHQPVSTIRARDVLFVRQT